jgi:dTDP-4-amino-4,6-dideoxy-D-galactose acyltransferase
MPSFEILPWDSAFFGVRIARIIIQNAAREELSEAVFQAGQNGVQCLYWLVNSADELSPRAATECGFRLVDVRVTFEHSLEIPVADAAPLPEVRSLLPADLPAILALARDSHRDSRFFWDGNFTKQQCQSLYEEWLRKSCQGGMDAVYIADAENRPAGYCVCSVSPEGAGNIGLIAVDPRWRQARLGTAMVANALRYFRSAGMQAATVVTQGRNLASQRLYQRCGFITKSVHLWYHRWRSEQGT